MNRIYRLIWNHRINNWVVVSELTRARGKKGSGRVGAGIASALLTMASICAGAADLVGLAPDALPTGGTVVVGEAAITSSGARMDITQETHNAIINWQGFEIGSDALVNFAQPDSTSVTLNRVSGPNISRIEGQLTANGQVFLINPNGVLFGNGARVNASALVASTLNIRDDDFLTGKYAFFGAGGAIENRGMVTAAPGGYLAFIAPKIANLGTLSAPRGTVALGAGERVTLNFAGNRLVGLSVGAETLDTLIENRQAIRAAGGAILLSAAAAESVTRSVINQDGLLEASSLTEDGGTVVLSAGQTFVGKDAVILANGGLNGDGGNVTVWADRAAQMYGTISARGGASSGDGGFVEVSGKDHLDFQGSVDLRATNGSTGTLLLDPTDITISAAASTPSSAFSTDTFSNPITTPSNLNVTTLTNQLALSNVIVSTTSGLAGAGDITVNNAINYNSANSLTLSANRSIALVAGSSGINNSGTGAVTLTGGGAGSIAANESITSGGGVIALTSGTAGVTLAASKSIDAGAGTIAIDAGGGAANFSTGTLRTSNAGAAVSITNATTVALGNVALTGGGALSVSHSGAGSQSTGTLISGSGALNKAGFGTLTLSQVNTYTGTTTVNGGVLSIAGGNAIVDSGNVVLANTASVALDVAGNETIGGLSGGGAVGGNVTKVAAGTTTLTTGGNGSSTTFAGVIQNGAGVLNLVKEGAGTLTLTNTNTYTGTTAASGGTLALSGATGSATGSNLIVNAGARLLLDNSTANNNDRVAGTLTLNGGEFAMTGNATTNTTESLGALNLTSGYSTVTLTPDALRNTQVTFGSLARTAGASALFRGTNLGANTIASQTAGTSNIVFTTAPTLTGGGGPSGATNVSIVTGTIGAGGASGSTSAGTDFVTYNPAGSINGLRPLLATEYAAAPGANVNLRVSTNLSTDSTVSINSLLLSGGITYNPDSTGGANTLTIASGNVLSVNGTNTIQPTITTGAVAFGANEIKLFTVGDLTLGSNAPITGTALLGKSGSGQLLENRAVTRTGGIVINSGAFRAGLTNAFASQAMTVRAAGALDLNGLNHTVTALTLESGATTGSSVATGAGTLALGGTLTLNANGTGATGALVSGNLAMTATRTFTINNGVAIDDLTVAALISGAGGLTKGGTGTLALSNANTYTGVTSIGAGTLNANMLANGGLASSIGASSNAATNLVLGANAVLQYSGANATTNRNYTLTAAQTSSINVSSAATNLTLSGASVANTGALAKLGAGTLTLSGANLHTGLTTVGAGTLAYGATNALDAGAVTVTGGATLDIGGWSDTVGAVTLTNGTITGTTGVLSATGTTVSSGTVSAILGGTGGVTKTTAGTVAMTRNNTYTGATSVNLGILDATTLANGAAASSIGASSNAATNLVLGGGILRYTGATVATDRNYTLTAGTTSSIDVAIAGTTLTVGGASAATNGALTKLGEGTLALTGANANTGATTIRTGTLQVGDGGATGNLGTGAVVDQGRLVFNRNNAVTVANGISGFGELVQQGTGTTTLTGASTNSGATTINTGTLQLGAANRLSDTSAVTVASGATLSTGTFADTVGSVDGAGNIVLGGTLISGGNNVSTTFSGAVSGTGGLTKAGTGTLTLSGANSYSGATSVNAGTLVAGNAAALGATSSGTTVASGATLNVNNVAIGTEALTLAGTGVAGAGALTGTGTASAAGIVTANTTTIGTTSAASSLTLGGVVTAATPLTIVGPGTLTATNAANNFSTVTVTGAGGVSLRDANAITINASTLSGPLSVQTAGAVTVAGTISSTAAGNAIVLSGNRFINSVGASALSALNGRWLVWSSNATPFSGATPDNRNGLAYAFKQYGATFGVTPVAQPTGNGFLYSIAPTVTPGLTGTTTKVYDGSTTATLLPANFTATGAVDGDSVAFTSAGATYINKNVGAGKAVTATGLAATATNGAATVYGYTPSSTSATANIGTITPATLVVTAQADSRTYNGTTTSSAAPVITGSTYDAVGTAATQSFNNRNAGTGKTLTAGGLVMADGNGGNNYSISYVSNAAGVITPASVTVTAQADSRVYNGTAASSTAPVLSGTTYDSVGTAAVQTFNNRNAGTGKTLAAAGLVMADGNGGANYTVSYVNNTAGVITPAGLTVTAQADSRVYDGTTTSSAAPVVTGTTYDAVGTAASQTFDNRNAGTGKTLAAGGLVMADGNGGANYTINYVGNTAGVITPASVTVAAQADNRVYDGTTASSVAPVVSGATYDAIGTVATQTFDNRNAGTGKTLTATGLVLADGNGGANYTVSYINSTAGVITPATLTVTSQTDNRGYDGTAASGAVPVLAGATYDAVGTAATQTFDNRNAGTGKTLASSGLVMADGNGGGNYAVSYVDDTTGVINPAALVVTAQADTRGYNGTIASSAAPVVSGATYDAIGTAATQTFDNRNVGTGKTLTAGGLVMADGNGGNNYAVSYANNTAGVITTAGVVVTAQTDNRLYNGTTTSSVAPVVTGATFDAIGTAATQTFDSRNAGTGKTLTAGGLVLADGNGGANYAISYVNNTGSIVPAPLVVIAQPDTRVYNGTTSSSVSPMVTGTTYDPIGTAAAQNFDSRNVGTGKTLAAGGLVMADGNGGANYIVTYANNLAGIITPAPLVVTAQPDNRVYNGTAFSGATPIVSGSTYDAVGAPATQLFDNRNAGTGKTLTPNGLVMADGNAGANYTISYVNSATGVITPAPLSVIADDAERQATQPNPQFTATYSGLVGGDTPASLTGTLAFSTPANGSSPMGTYPITPLGQSSTNYAITYVDGVLTITTQPRPPEFAAWARLDAQALAASYSSQAPAMRDVRTLKIDVATGGLNVHR